jgi:hypothetical protein
MEMRRSIQNPSLFPRLLIHRRGFHLGALLAGFWGIYKATGF